MDSRRPVPRRRLALTVGGALVMLGMMTTLVAYSVPLYRWFCQVTGYGGTTQIAEIVPDETLDRIVTIQFNGDVNSRLPWRFAPVQREVEVRLGEQRLAFYSAENVSDEPIVGTATFNVTPAKAGQYFVKIDCFCFTEQTLDPGQRVEMPVSFFVDPALADDPNLSDVTTITLSYTFFRQVDDRARGDGERLSRADVRPAAAIN